MKLLWTIANWKRTGPVGPSLDLAKAVEERGHDVRVEVGRPDRRDPNTSDRARTVRDLVPAGVGARLHKHAFLLRDLPDVTKLARWMRKEKPDVVVTTLANDNRLALAAVRRVPEASVARLWFHAGDGEIHAREQKSLRATSRIFVFGERPAARLRELGIAADRVHLLGAPLDVAGIRAQAARSERPSALGVPSDVFLVGIVARIQTHRLWGLLWEALSRLTDGAWRGAPVHLVVLGRGTHQEAVALGPVRERGLTDHVTFAGYLTGDDYASTLASFDAQLFLVPGSDPTCRALREGMALGVPSVTTRRGLLPSIVADGESGFLVDETPGALADAIRRLAEDPDAARRMGAAAGRRAEQTFAADRVADCFLAALSGTSD